MVESCAKLKQRGADGSTSPVSFEHRHRTHPAFPWEL